MFLTRKWQYQSQCDSYSLVKLNSHHVIRMRASTSLLAIMAYWERGLRIQHPETDLSRVNVKVD